MKIVLFIITLLTTATSYAQTKVYSKVVTPINYQDIKIDTLTLKPTDTVGIKTAGRVIFRLSDSTFYQYDGRKWRVIGADTSGQFVSSVSKINDTTLNFQIGTTSKIVQYQSYIDQSGPPIIKYDLLPDYASVTSMPAPDLLTVVKVDNDEHKGIQDAIYFLYPDGKRIWVAATSDGTLTPATTFNSLGYGKFINVSNYATMIGNGRPLELTIYHVTNDESKGTSDIIYIWTPDNKRVWIAGISDN